MSGMFFWDAVYICLWERTYVPKALGMNFYAQKQLLLSARLSHRNSVRLSVRPSVCHTGGSLKNVAR